MIDHDEYKEVLEALESGFTGKVKKRKADNYCPSCGQALDWER